VLPRLITEAEAGTVLRLRDRRTIRRHLADLGVGRVRVGGRWLVDGDALELAIRDRMGAATGAPAGSSLAARYGVRLAPGQRLGGLALTPSGADADTVSDTSGPAARQRPGP
jgi:hypothetical protein